MPPKTRSEKAKIQSKKTKNHTEPQMMEEEHPPVPHKTKRKADRGAEELVKEVPEKKAPSKKIKQLSFAPPTFPASTPQFTNQTHTNTFSFKTQPDRNHHSTNPFSDILLNMRSNLSLSKNPKDLEEEYRLLEELISTENRYHALKFKQIIIDLKSKDELKIMDAVTRLSTELSMAQEENFGSLQLDFLIPELIRCLQMDNAEIMMHSAVSITHILDIMPAASKILVNSGGIEVLCQKMQNFEYIDVAESSIKALEKVSGDFGLSILNAGGMEIMLTMIDFFVVQTQKLIMSIISNIFKLVNSETMLKEKILPVLPLVLSYTQSDPSRQEIMYNMIHRLSDRVVRLCGEDFEKKREYLEIIAQDRMTGNFCQVLNDLIESFDQAKLENIENILKTLNKFCYYSLTLCMEAFDSGIISIFDKLIGILESPAGKENQFSNLAYETISLVNSILALRATPHPLIGKIAAYVGIKITENCNVQGRMEMFKNHPYIFQNLIEKVGVRLPGIFENNAGTLFKYIVLISFQKLVEFSDTESLTKHFDLQVIANFLSKLTTSNDIMIIAITFIIVDLLITKIPETYVILTREGVVDYVKALSSVTEANKLEAYSVAAKRYNPLDTLKQFTTSLNRMAANSGSNDFLANLEAESQRLESIMQQLQFMRNPPESFSDSNESKTLSSAEEGSPEKSPAKSGLFSLQSLPKTAPLEHKFITALNRRQNKDSGAMEEEILSLEKPVSNQPVDKVAEIRRDIAVYAQEIYNRIKEEMQKKNLPHLAPASIINKLEEISLSLEQNQWNPTEFGQKDFQKYLDLVGEHGRITNYELKNSKILSHLLNFIFDNVLAKSSPSKDLPEGPKGRRKSKTAPKEEEKKTNSSDDLDKEQPKEKKQIELNDQQCRTILGRIISFLYHFKKINNKATEEIHLQDFLKNLQEMLMNSDQFSLDSARNYQEYENNLNSDMRFLAQRVKFRAQYNPAADSESAKKNAGMPNMLKQKSMISEEEKKIFPSSLDNQAEMFSYKDAIFKEVPILALSVEQFGTLEVIEDYLLNKLNSKDDLNGGLFGRNVNDFISQRFGNPQETRDSEEDPSSQERESMELEGTKNKVPVTNPKTKSPGSIPLQKSHSTAKTKHEGKFIRNEKKKWVDRLTGKEVNFKKYLECKFYVNGEELDKNITIYEIFSKYKSTNTTFSGGFGDLGVEYKLALKKMETFEFSSGSRDQYKQTNMICLDPRTILQNLANRISSLDLKSTESSSVREIIQMIIFIHELVDLDRKILSPATVLNTLLIDLKNRYGLGELITAYKEESVQLVRKEIIPKNEFVNKKISLVAYKYLNDPITLAGGLVPDLLREICEKAPFILDFKSKYHYYKNGCFHISRALHYIYQINKTRLKDLEGSRIGKIHRKKVKVARDKILENAVVNFESYGSKKSVLDFEFQDEEGTGLGPTLEYYSIVASEMKNPEHHLWQKTANNLLFPSPIDPSDLRYPDPEKSKKRLQDKTRDFEKFQLVFRCIGTLLGRAILDERIVDLPLHAAFWDIILEKPLYIEDVSKIDPNLGDTLLGLQEVCNKKQEIENDQNLTPAEKNERISELQFKGCAIEDLTLTFTLPGYDDIELVENGVDMPVTISNLDQYVSLLTKFILIETLKSQVFAFREGFDKVIPLRHLQIFESDEIEALVCGGTRDEAWDIKTLEDNFIPAHGYTQSSKSFKNFIQIVSEFTSEEKRIFLKFVTGAERLPFGGFKNLNPKLTVVKKQPNHHTEHPDQYLPSVMTCQNYVKLPDYSTLEAMKKKLFFSMKEGQNSFSLS